MHNAFGEFQNALLQLLKVITNFKTKTKHAVTITTNILFMCLLLVLGVTAPLGILSTFSPLKARGLAIDFQKIQQ